MARQKLISIGLSLYRHFLQGEFFSTKGICICYRAELLARNDARKGGVSAYGRASHTRERGMKYCVYIHTVYKTICGSVNQGLCQFIDVPDLCGSAKATSALGVD
jgi:hypothetical protein